MAKKKKIELDWCFLTFKAKNAFLIAKPVKISDKNKKSHQAYKLSSLTIVRKVTTIKRHRQYIKRFLRFIIYN